MEELFSNAITRVPAMENAEVKKFFNGPEAFTPDADFLLGETDVRGFWVAAGGCAHGLAGAGGVGKVMGEWIVDGRPEWDVWPLDVRRFGRQYRSQAVHARAFVRGALAVLRHQVPGRGEAGGPAAARLAGVRAASGARCVVRREGRLGARQLVRVERGGRRRVAAAARLGGRELVARDRGRGARGARGSRAVRPVVVLEAPGARPRRARVSRADVREPDRPSRRHDRLHAAAECARRDRGRSLGDAVRRRWLPARHRHGVRDARPRVAREARAARRLGVRERRDVGVRVPLPLGAEGARRARSPLPVHDSRARSRSATSR